MSSRDEIAARAAFVAMAAGVAYCAERWPRATLAVAIGVLVIIGPPPAEKPACPQR